MDPFKNIVTGNKMRMIAYTSDCRIPEITVRQAFYEIVLQSLGSNELAGINSVLFYDQHRFFQVIEGPDHAAKMLYQNIQADTRHGKLRMLIDAETGRPSFGGIAMQAYLIDQQYDSADPAYERMKAGFKELCSGDIEHSGTMINFTRTMMTALDQYLVLR